MATENHTLYPTGRRPLAFAGDLLAQAETPERFAGRTFRLLLYRTCGGSFVAVREYLTQWERECTTCDLAVSATLADAAEFFTSWQPTPECMPGVGFPPGAQFETRQQRLFQELACQYRALVTALLAQVPEAAEHLA